MSKRVLVTGASGMVGRALVGRLLEAGYQVRCLTRRVASLDWLKGQVEIMEGNITSPAISSLSVRGMDTVIHLAGLAHTRMEHSAFSEVNGNGTLNMTRASVQAGVSRFIYISSMSVYGDTPPPFIENGATQPTSAYGRSKLEAENHVRELGDRGVSYTILRPSAIYGPYDRGNTMRMIRAIDKGWWITIGDRPVRKSLTYVDNVVDAILRVMEHPGATNQIFNLSDTKPYGVLEVANAIATTLGRPFRLVSLPRGVAYFGARILEIVARLLHSHPKITTRDIDVITSDAFCTIDHISSRIGYEPRITLKEGLDRTIRWYQRNGQ